MPLLSVSKKRQIITTLGYPWNSDNLFPQLELDYPSDIVLKIDEILAQISSASLQKQSTLGNIQLKKVDEIEFQPLKDSDYLSAFENLAHDSLSQLSDLVCIPLAYGLVHNLSYQ